MHHDWDLAGGREDDADWWWQVKSWFTYYWRPTRGWMPKVSMWWAYEILRYPKRPPFDEDPVARHLGLVEGVPPCTDKGPNGRCAEHRLVTHGG